MRRWGLPHINRGSRWQRWVRGHSCAHINRGSRWQRWVRGHGCAHINRGSRWQRWVRGHGCAHINRGPRDSAGSSDLTESKYAAYCREATNWPEGEDELKTWGEVVQYGDRVLDHLENVTVPEELKDYHNALIAVFKSLHDFSRRQDASEPYDENLVNQDYDVAVEFGTLLGFSGTLDSEAVSQMRDAGCLL